MIERRRYMGGNQDQFIQFADQAMKALCVGLWGGADGGTAALNTRVNNVKVTGIAGEITYEQAESILTIVENQFQNNTTITSFDELQFFTKLQTIGAGAFLYCNNLVSLNLPINISVLGENSIRSTSISYINIPDSIIEIRYGAFNYNSKLTTVIINAITPPTFGRNVFNNNKGNRIIYVPNESVEAYKSVENLSPYIKYIKGISEL